MNYFRLVRAVASGNKGASCPPAGLVDPDTSSLWLDLLSLDSVILIIATCSVCYFHQSRSFFRRHLMTSAENSVSESPNLKIFWGKISPELSTRLVPSALAILPLGYKKPSDGPVSSIHEIEMWNYKKMESDTWEPTTLQMFHET